MDELPLLASLADRFQMTEVTSVLEEVAMGKLSVDMIGDVLMWSRVWDAAAGGRSPGDGGNAIRGVHDD
jgi:hypothetical protein